MVMKKLFLYGLKWLIAFTGLTIYVISIHLFGDFSVFSRYLVVIMIILLLLWGFMIVNRCVSEQNDVNQLEKRKHFIIRGNQKIEISLLKRSIQMLKTACGQQELSFGYSFSYQSYTHYQNIMQNNNTDKRSVQMPTNMTDASGDGKQRDLILNMDHNGIIRFVSQDLLVAYQKEWNDFYGKHISEVSHYFGIDSTFWMDHLRNKYHTQSTVEVAVGDEKKWFYWNFEAITDESGLIDIIIASGTEITDFIYYNQSQQLSNMIDFQTGLLNQHGLKTKMAQIGSVKRAAVFFIDLWNFSRINDYYGFSVGDEIILMISSQLKMMKSDHCLISRFSGDKFVGFCYSRSGEEFVLDALLNKLKDFVSSVYHVQENAIQIDKRIGYAIYPDDTDEMDKLVSLASLAMKSSNQTNQFSIVHYDQQMGDSLKKNIVTATKLKTAIEKGIVEVHFQKAVDARSGKAIFIEELARWHDDELGNIPPFEFLATAKEANLMDQLDRYLVHEAIKEYSVISLREEFAETVLAINIAAMSFLDNTFQDYVIKTAKQYDIASNRICIEISESTFENNVDKCVERIITYKQSGFVIALDDFGKDYSSLAILERVPFDIIKIDKIFIDRVSDDKNQEIVRMIRTITKLYDKEIIAEGVETEFQKQCLLELGCWLHQGYLYHRPERLL
jgi:diguanylate cyclase (GGDEF)-like protein